MKLERPALRVYLTLGVVGLVSILLGILLTGRGPHLTPDRRPVPFELDEP
jgi:hypothetical protein